LRISGVWVRGAGFRVPSPEFRATDPTQATLNPKPQTLHPEPCTLLPTPLHPAPCTLHPAPYTLHPTPWNLAGSLPQGIVVGVGGDSAVHGPPLPRQQSCHERQRAPQRVGAVQHAARLRGGGRKQVVGFRVQGFGFTVWSLWPQVGV
jgi:hypothetical protein